MDIVQFVACNLGNEEYGVEIKYVQEIIRILKITRVPHAPAFLEGVINLRGKVIPVLDLRKLFNQPPRIDTDDTRIIIINYKGILLGIIVDQVSEVINLSSDKMESASTVSKNTNSAYFDGVGKIDDRLVILLNLEEITKSLGK